MRMAIAEGEMGHWATSGAKAAQACPVIGQRLLFSRDDQVKKNLCVASAPGGTNECKQSRETGEVVVEAKQ